MKRYRPKKDDGWGGNWKNYKTAKQDKLNNQFTNKTSKDSLIFSGISIYVNGYTEPSADKLKEIMMRYGGKYNVYYNSKVTTHIIATNLPNSKIVMLKKEKVVKPEWITDSVEAGRCLPEEPYLLYKKSSSQQLINFSKNELDLKSVNATLKNAKADENAHSSKGNGMLATNDEHFIDEFHNKSRLHHISTMCLELKSFVQSLQGEFSGSYPERQRLQEWMSKKCHQNSNLYSFKTTIMHIDMDCFFVSVGLRNLQHLKGKPVVVTHARIGTQHITGVEVKKRSMSDIACCSYEARQSGVKNGMLLGRALELCPDIIAIPYDFEGYKEVARILYKTVASYTLDVEAVSCDELYIDCTSLLFETNATEEGFAECLRNDILMATGCTCSVGIGSNFLMARLATKKAKPNGIFTISLEQQDEFIKMQCVQSLPGIGINLASRLKDELNVETCADLQNISLVKLQNLFGSNIGQTMFNLCRGMDNREIRRNSKRTTVSSEINYGIRLKNLEETVQFLENLSKDVSSRLKRDHLKGSCITLKLKVRKADAPLETPKFMGHGLCDNTSLSVNVGVPTNEETVIARESVKLFKKSQVIVTDVRGVGIQLHKLIDETKEKPVCTLDKYVKSPNKHENALIEASSPVHRMTSPKGSPTTRNSPRRGSPKQSVQFRYRAINEHFGKHSRSKKNVFADLNKAEIGNGKSADLSQPLNVNLTVKELISFDEIILQIKLWITTTEDPLKEQIVSVSDVIKELVKRSQLEQAVILLKLMNRWISKNSTPEWKTVETKLRGIAQATAFACYGGYLNLEN